LVILVSSEHKPSRGQSRHHGDSEEPESRGSTPTQYIACSVRLQPHGTQLIVTTACWANKDEGGVGDTQVSKLYSTINLM